MSGDAPVRGRKAIAAALGCSVRTTYRLERLPTDPLRLRSSDHNPQPWALRSRLVAYGQRMREDPAAPRTESWPHIAALLGVSVDLAQRLERRDRDPLPVWRTGARVWAYTHALLDWLDAQDRPHQATVFRGGPTTREDVCPPAGKRSEGHARDSATGDRARRAPSVNGAVKMENSCPPQKGRVAA